MTRCRHPCTPEDHSKDRPGGDRDRVFADDVRRKGILNQLKI